MPIALALLLLSQSPTVVTPREPLPVAPLKWEVLIALQGGLRPDTGSFGSGALIAVNRELFSFLRAELALGLGAYAAPVDVLTMIRVGIRLEWPGLERWHPFLALGFAHHHESAWEHISTDPVPAIIGLSEHGVHHRSGLETGAGVTYDLPARKGLPIGGRLGGKLSVTHLLGEGAPRTIELSLLAGLRF